MSSRWVRLELTVHPEWQLVERVRTAATAGLAMLLPPERCEILGMVVSELLENALKYGDYSKQHGVPAAAHLKVVGTETEVEIVVEHPVHDGSDHLRRLFTLLGRLAAAESPEQAYVDQLREVAIRDGGSGGLGLARICYEASCRIDARQLPDGRLRIATRVPTVPASKPVAVEPA